jgi:hypothetical protein
MDHCQQSNTGNEILRNKEWLPLIDDLSFLEHSNNQHKKYIDNGLYPLSYLYSSIQEIKMH